MNDITDTSDITIRLAELADADVIARFNILLAQETEEISLDPPTIFAGVRAVLEDSRKGRYFLACIGECIVGQMMHTFEWSDWRNGELWWLQSVYVEREFRRRGVFRRLFQHVLNEAKQSTSVRGIRLYVENENHRAHRAYQELGLEQAGYFVLQHLFV
ncbi:MAG: N-acetyltransferase family protein [Planctomycetaceae bacterium]